MNTTKYKYLEALKNTQRRSKGADGGGKIESYLKIWKGKRCFEG